MNRVPDRAPDRAFDPRMTGVPAAPLDNGVIELIVRRPGTEQRELVTEALLDPVLGLVGDCWLARGSRSTPDRSANPDAQLTLMSTRVLAAIEPDRSRWPLAGDQLYADLDLSIEHLPAGTRLAMGDALVEVSETPHTGCAKFSARFGSDALRWINAPAGRELRLRGVNLRILTGGTVRVGDRIRRVPA